MPLKAQARVGSERASGLNLGSTELTESASPSLSRWQRLGIVLSVLWILGAAWIERSSQIAAARDTWQIVYARCISETPAGKSDNCTDTMEKTYQVLYAPHWENVAYMAFGPVVLAWLLAWITRATLRWVMAGRK